jgi:hypothetical protein
LIVIRNSDLWSAVIEAEVSCPPTYRKSPEPLQFDEELVNQGKLMGKKRRQKAHRNIVRRERKCGESGFIKLCRANWDSLLETGCRAQSGDIPCTDMATTE